MLFPSLSGHGLWLQGLHRCRCRPGEHQTPPLPDYSEWWGGNLRLTGLRLVAASPVSVWACKPPRGDPLPHFVASHAAPISLAGCLAGLVEFQWSGNSVVGKSRSTQIRACPSSGNVVVAPCSPPSRILPGDLVPIPRRCPPPVLPSHRAGIGLVSCRLPDAGNPQKSAGSQRIVSLSSWRPLSRIQASDLILFSPLLLAVPEEARALRRDPRGPHVALQAR
jgi:hypothetical protein